MNVMHGLLAFGMLATGSINTIAGKLADSTNSTGLHGDVHLFDHPYLQTNCMFVGEMLCLVVFYFMRFVLDRPSKEEYKPFPRYVFALPAFCDMFGTSLMYLALTLTYPSVFQMLRSTVIIFTGVLSVTVLKRQLRMFHWFSMIVVLVGGTLVALASVLSSHSPSEASNPLLGCVLIAVAQVIVAVQMIIEEKLLAKYEVQPMEAVGLEGFWGFIMLSTVLVLMYYIPGSRQGSFENSLDALYQIGNSGMVRLAIAGTIVSIALFNFFGVSVTKHMSASHRMVLDSLRNLVVWMVALVVGWEHFQWLQLLGFAVLLVGVVCYNRVVDFPCFEYETPEREYALLNAAESGDTQKK